MKIVKYTSGVYSAEYVADFNPGDLITAYEKGYHRFVRYEARGKEVPLIYYGKEVPLIYYTRAFNFNGKSCKSSKEISCDAAYCRPASDHIMAAIKQKQDEIDALINLKETL